MNQAKNTLTKAGVDVGDAEKTIKDMDYTVKV